LWRNTKRMAEKEGHSKGRAKKQGYRNAIKWGSNSRKGKLV